MGAAVKLLGYAPNKARKCCIDDHARAMKGEPGDDFIKAIVPPDLDDRVRRQSEDDVGKGKCSAHGRHDSRAPEHGDK